MKNLFAIFILLHFAFQSEAQHTIKKSNYPVLADYIDVDYTKSGVLEAPQGGENQLWDYSAIPLGNFRETEYKSAVNDPDFENALNYRRRIAYFQEFAIPNDSYEQVDETGHYEVGQKVVDTTIPISTITGGAEDVIRFPPIVKEFELRNYYVKFPMNYQSVSQSQASVDTEFELTVVAFGLNQTPGYARQFSSVEREVIGYGNLIIPMEDGTPSPPIEALLVESKTTAIDSFFLGGAPAPPALLAAFGVSQGAVIEHKPTYSFYTPEVGETVFYIDLEDEFYSYSPAAAHPKGKLKITQANFPRRASIPRVHELYDVEFAAPSEGLNQVWDYSGLQAEFEGNETYTDATNSTEFPNALLFDSGRLLFQGFDPPTNFYEGIDENGWFYLGKTMEENAYSITALTGGSNDILRFPEDIEHYEGRVDRLQFPTTYGKQWTQSQIETTKFELSIAAFGLDNVAGTYLRHLTATRTVVGEGTIIIPSEDGTGTVSTEALLVKIEETGMDSVFLGGTPAPAALLAAFGLTQGGISYRTTYEYYRPNSATPILTTQAGESPNPMPMSTVSILRFFPSVLDNPCGDGIQNGDETGIDCGGAGCAPCGDLCINATSLEMGTNTTGNTLHFTDNDLNDSCEGIDAPSIGVWYTFVGTGTDITLSTDHAGTEFDTNLQVFAGECGDLVCVAADEDGGEDYVHSYISHLTFESIAGTTYYVYLFGFYSETGNYELSLSANALPISISHDRVCDTPSEGLSEVTVIISGGTAPYQVSGNFNGEVEENEPFTFILEDGQNTYEISVVDATGAEAQVLENVLPCTKLPVELLFFEGEVMTDGNLLQWTTASELNNDYFTLSYSTDGQNFFPLQKIEGNGTTSTANSYEFLHRNAPTGTTYYQLTQTDLDGTSKNLGVIGLKRGEATGTSTIEIYPSPTKHQLNIDVDFVNTSTSMTLNIYDSMGRVAQSQTLSDNSTSIRLDVSNLLRGTYFLQANNGLETLTSKFVKF